MKKTPAKKAKKPLDVGQELVRRLRHFNEILDTTDNLPDQFTCRTIRLNLQPKGYHGADVKKVRTILGVSQALFAQFAGVSAAAVKDWEQDIKPPNGAVCRLMDEIIHNPAYFQSRIRELATPVGKD
jgi:putative transcriptional regulator